MTATPPGQSPAKVPTVAAIDMGTNSFHMVIARAMPGGGFDVLTTQKDMVRLGKGSGEMKHLTEEAMERGLASLRRMLVVASSYDAEVWAVATSAVREAENRGEFLGRIKEETGLTVSVISGFEEARLIHLGVLQALPVFDKRLLLVDIGGGSTELLVGEGDTIKAVRSVKLGSIRLTDGFFRNQEVDVSSEGPSGREIEDAVRRCRDHVRSALAPAAHDLGPLGHEVAVGSSGTISSVAAMISGARGDEPRQSNGTSFTKTELDELIERLIAATPAERLEMEGLDERRADIIVAGSLLLQGVFETMGVTSMTVSGYALREGVLYDHLGANQDGNRRLADLRRSNALRLSQQLDPDADHAEVCARLAVRLFDETKELHELGQADRDLLDMAALVHNVGLFISHASHHRHTYYVVRNSEQLTGFSDHELEMLALVARYHRKGHPSDRHREYAQLEPVDKRRVSILAGLLRIAIGLDRGHQGSVGDLIAVTASQPPSEIGGDSSDSSDEDWPHQSWLVIRPVAVDTDIDISLEVYSAQQRSALLSEALGVNVVVGGAPTSD